MILALATGCSNLPNKMGDQIPPEDKGSRGEGSRGEGSRGEGSKEGSKSGTTKGSGNNNSK